MPPRPHILNFKIRISQVSDFEIVGAARRSPYTRTPPAPRVGLHKEDVEQRPPRPRPAERTIGTISMTIGTSAAPKKNLMKLSATKTAPSPGGKRRRLRLVGRASIAPVVDSSQHGPRLFGNTVPFFFFLDLFPCRAKMNGECVVSEGLSLEGF